MEKIHRAPVTCRTVASRLISMLLEPQKDRRDKKEQKQIKEIIAEIFPKLSKSQLRSRKLYESKLGKYKPNYS